MIKISQKEFETKIQDVIDGKTTRTRLLSELHTDRINLNNKIQELVIYNPKLYETFINKFPYRPVKYTHIDYEALIIDILKKGYSRRQWDEVYEGVSSRTIQRKIKDMEKSNSELAQLYKEVSRYRKEQKPLPKRLQAEIDLLEEREIFLGGVCDKIREELIEKEKIYTDARMKGTTDEVASKKVGRTRVSKLIDTLNRIELEKQVKENKSKENGER